MNSAVWAGPGRAPTVGLVTAIAQLPDLVRGYESIKEANVARYRAALAELEARLEASAAGAPLAAQD